MSDIPISPTDWRGTHNTWTFGVGDTKDFYTFTGMSSIKCAYDDCPPLAAIVNRCASAFIAGNTWLMDSGGKEANGVVAEGIRTLLKSPNPLQTWTQFEAQLSIYIQLYEQCLILPIYSVGFESKPPAQLWIIPPDIVTYQYKTGAYWNTGNYIQSVMIAYASDITVLPYEKFIHIKGYVLSSVVPVIPGSRIKSIAKNINNLIGIYDSKNVLINYRGSMGILSQEKDTSGAGNIPLEESEKDDIQSGLMQYGLRSSQKRYIITNASLSWQSMQMPYKDLMLSEWAQDDVMVLCDALNYPYRLLAAEKSASYNDVKEFKKMLYQDHIIPLSKIIYEQLTEGLQLDKHGIHLEKDYSEIYALQEEEGKKATARKVRNEALQIEFMNNLITLNRWRELNGEDTVTDGNKYYYELLELGYVFGSKTSAPQNSSETQNEQHNDNN